MATAPKENARQNGNPVTAAFEDAKVRVMQFRVYRKTLRALSAMSDADLRAVGLSREMIRPIAREASLAA